MNQKIAIFTILLMTAASMLVSCEKVSISEETLQQRPHYKVETESATYYYDKAGGGFSRIVDVDGTDWVQFNGSADVDYPDGAASGFRGVPNLVFRSEDGGAGHPGFDQCVSEMLDDKTILTKSKSGNWQWRWTFYNDHARMSMEKTDPEHAYWFLYEGPVAGKFKPARQYWGTDTEGTRFESPSLNEGEHVAGTWQWAYFGDTTVNRVFFTAQQNPDSLSDYFAYMGSTDEANDAPDGMVVFGFGRAKGAKPLMTDTNSFVIGFLEGKVLSGEEHATVRHRMNKLLAE
jgi:hypothetical protein